MALQEIAGHIPRHKTKDTVHSDKNLCRKTTEMPKIKVFTDFD